MRPLRDRDDLTPDVLRVLALRRDVGGPWVEDHARVIAEFCGYTPTEPWPGAVMKPWDGFCHNNPDHRAAPRLNDLLNGAGVCGPCAVDSRYSELRATRKRGGSRHLRDRDDLPPEVAAVVMVSRHNMVNPWTDAEAHLVAKFCGLTPDAGVPFPGAGAEWPGECPKGHKTAPILSNLLKGQGVCGHPDCKGKLISEGRIAKSLNRIYAYAAERGDEIVAYDFSSYPRPGIGKEERRAIVLTVRWSACGHETDGVIATTYIRGRWGCAYCSSQRLLIGFNDLRTLEPQIASEVAPPWNPEAFIRGSNKSIAWECQSCNYRWESTINNRTNSLIRRGCPNCAEAGFSSNLPGALYVVTGFGPSGLELIKFGIANTVARNPEKPSPLRVRLQAHAKQGLETTLALWRRSAGEVVEVAERTVKETLRGASRPSFVHRATKDDLPDGYTEAIVASTEAREWLLDLVKASLAEAAVLRRTLSPGRALDVRP
jgi:hypothetical protein